MPENTQAAVSKFPTVAFRRIRKRNGDFVPFTARKITDAMTVRVRELLAENAQKRKRGQHKQQMKKCDIHTLLQAEGYTIGYTSLCG